MRREQLRYVWNFNNLGSGSVAAKVGLTVATKDEELL